MLSTPETPIAPVNSDTSNGFDTPKTEYVSSDTTNTAIDGAVRLASGDTPGEFKLGTLSNNKITGGLSSLLSRNYSTSRFLNNIRINIGGKFQPVANYITQLQTSMRPQVRDSIVRDVAGIDITGQKWKAPKTLPKDLIGTKSTQGVEITPADLAILQKTYDNVAYFDKPLPGMTAAETQAFVKSSMLYDFLKQKEGAAEKVFTPEQIAALKRMEDVERSVYGSVSQKAMTDGVYKGLLADNYLHFDMIRKNYERLPKNLRKEITAVIDGRTQKFADFLEMEDAIRVAERLGKSVDPKAYTTLEKSKAGNIVDMYRTHGAAARILSYADLMGKAYADTKSLGVIESLRESKDPNIQSYLRMMDTGGWNKNIGEQILGYNNPGGAGKLAQTVSSVGSQLAIIGNPAVYTQGVLSASLKNVTDAIAGAGENLVRSAKYAVT